MAVSQDTTPLSRRHFARLAASHLAAATAIGATTTACSTLAAAEHPDAELIRLGAEFDRRYALYLEQRVETDQYLDEFDEEVARRSPQPRICSPEWIKLRIDMGTEAAIDRNNAALDFVGEVANTIRATPAQTFTGLAVKARLLTGYDCYTSDDFALPEQEMDWDVACLHRFRQEVERLAGAVS